MFPCQVVLEICAVGFITGLGLLPSCVVVAVLRLVVACELMVETKVVRLEFSVELDVVISII